MSVRDELDPLSPRRSLPRRERAARQASPREAIGPRLNFLVHNLSRDRAAAFNRLMEPHGITRAQAWAIGALSKNGGMTQTELAAELGLTRVAAGTLLGRLDAAGLVERHDDSEDGRVKRVYLTERCKPLRRLIDRAAATVNLQSLEGLTDAEVETLINLLQRVQANLRRWRAQTA